MRIDNPTTEDKLGFEPYVRGIEDLIRKVETSDLPLTLGIYGSWGSGKSSFMMQLQKRLDTNNDDTTKRIPNTWFEAWKYDRLEDVRSALVNQIFIDLQRRTSDESIRKGINQKVEEIRKILGGLFMRSHLSIGFGGSGINLASLEEAAKYADNTYKFQTEVDKISGSFSEAVNLYLKNIGEDFEKKLVVFIDDLDRCLPENVIIILEALKLFLTDSHCVFIIGIDRTVAERAIQAHYQIEFGVSREYLDKVIHYPFNIPPASPDKLKDLFKEFIPAESLNEACLYIFDMAAQGNPRIYLRLITAWNIITALASRVTPRLWSDAYKHVLALSIALQVRFPQLYELCKNNPHGFVVFLQRCISPPSGQISEILHRDGATEYIPYWEIGDIKKFLRNLHGKKVGEGSGAIIGAEDLLKEALNLSTTVA